MCNRKKMTGRNVNPGLTEPFVLVYNGDKNQPTNQPASKLIYDSIRKKARFGLPGKLKGFCVKDVLTLTESEFSRTLLPAWRDAMESREDI